MVALIIFVLTELLSLNVTRNQISDFVEVSELVTYIPRLESLDLSLKPVAAIQLYREKLIVIGNSPN